jgi:Family of unknown function (DUF6634)
MLLFNQGEEPDDLFVSEMERIAALAADMERIRRGLRPEAMSVGEAPVLDRWVLGQTIVPCLVGLSTGHPRLAGENRLIVTSDLWLLSEDRSWARTLSRWYRLGRPAARSGLDS